MKQKTWLTENKKIQSWFKKLDLIDKKKEQISGDQFDFINNRSEKPGIIFNPNEFIESVYIESSFSKSYLCKLGEKYSTDKSPYNKNKVDFHRHVYTPFYDILFSTLKEKKINFAEIGILDNSSIKMWREFFPNANIYAFDYREDILSQAKLDNLKNVYYKTLDVRKTDDINKKFSILKEKGIIFDVILDDSSHVFEHQINIIKGCTQFLKKSGLLLIEDIYKYNDNYSKYNYYSKLKKYLKYFSSIKMVDSDHFNKFTEELNNDLILVLTRNSKKYIK